MWELRRVSVVGCSGSGKSTLAAALARRLGVPHVELDALYHQPGWQPLPDATFEAAVDARTAGPGWVVDGNYSPVRERVFARADTVVWLDLPRTTVMRAIVLRSLWRGITRMELWNGNRERLANLLRIDPQENIVLWAWTTHAEIRARYTTAMGSPRYAHLQFVRLRSRKQAASWLHSVPAGPDTAS